MAPEAENIERLRRALRSVFSEDSSIEEITGADLLGDYPAVQYCPPRERFIDVLTSLGETFHDEDIKSRRLILTVSA